MALQKIMRGAVVIGNLEPMKNGDIRVTAPTGKYLGQYDKFRDQTVDASGRLVADGCVPSVLFALQ